MFKIIIIIIKNNRGLGGSVFEMWISFLSCFIYFNFAGDLKGMRSLKYLINNELQSASSKIIDLVLCCSKKGVSDIITFCEMDSC